MTTPHRQINRRSLFTKWVTAFFAATAVSLLMGSVALAQNVTVNPGAGSYPTLKAAFDAINAGTHTGAITVDIVAPTIEAVTPAVLNSTGAGSASYTSVLIRPTADGLTVSGATVTGRGLIELNGADNVTIDGDNPNTAGTNRNLTITNTAANTITYASVIRIALATTIVTSADNNTFKNLILNGNATGRNVSTATSTTGSENTTYGILATGGASTVAATTAPTAISSTSTTIGSGAAANNLTVDNNTINSAGRGVMLQGSATTVFPGALISNNIIGNATAGGANQVYSFGASVQGSTNVVVRSNTVYVEGFVGTSIRGLDQGSVSATGSGTVFERNQVNRVQSGSATGLGAYGVNLAGGNTHTIRNNFVSGVINIPNVTFSLTNGAFGIRAGSGTGHLIYHNNVNMSGNLTGATGSALTGALAITSTAFTGLDVRNNIFVNSQTETGAATPASSAFVAIALPSAGTSAMNLTLNNNDYYNGATPAANEGVGQAGTTAGTGFYTQANFDPTATTPSTNLRSYTSTLSATGTNDNASKKVDPVFVSSADLHIQTTSPMESMGTNVGVTSDIDGDARGGAPDIGADEITLVGPGTLQFSSATYTGAEGTTATITVNRVGGVTGAVSVDYATSAGTATAGTCGTAGVDFQNMSGTLNWADGDSANKTFTVTLCSDTVSPEATETVSLTLSNVMGTTITGTNPATLNITDVPPPLSGSYNVGAGQTFTTLTSAINTLNTAGVAGPVTFTLTDASYTTPAETFPLTINAIMGASATNTVTIKPNTAVLPTISGSSATCIINLLGADFVTIDGSNAAGGTSKDLTITNTNTGTTSAVVCLTTTTSPGLGATNDVVKNTNITGNTNVTTLFGVFSGSSTISTTSLGTNNNSNTIQNNNVSKVQFGIFSQGASAAGKNTGNVITQNLLNTIGANAIGKTAILVGFEDGIQISQNTIDGLTSTSDNFGISLGLTGISTSTFTGNEVTNATVNRNYIGAVRNTGTFSACGIGVAPVTTVGAQTNTIRNNMVAGVFANGTSGDFSVGILIGGGNGTTNVYFNSVSITTLVGSPTNGSDKSYALAIGGSNPLVDIRNNVLYNTQSAGTGVNYAIGFGYSTFTNLISDYNNFFVTVDATHAIGGTGSLATPTAQTTLANLQSATGKDANSKNFDPLFISATDLHLQSSSPVLGQGIAIAGVTIDFDGETRDNPPDIGADEIVAVAAPGSLQFSTSAYSGNEGTTRTITVTRTSGTTGSVTVDYATSNGTATGGASCTGATDYVSAGGTLTFVDGVASQTFAVQLCSDAVVDPNETVILTLSNATGGATIGANNPATLIITDVPPPFNGSYTVGSGGNYTTLTSAITALNNAGVSGPTTFTLIDATYSGSETFPITINSVTGASATNTVTIKPAAGVSPSISGSSATALIVLNGADYVIIDGSNSTGSTVNTVCPRFTASRDTTFTNTNVGTTSAVIWLQTTAGADPATNNIVRNNNLVGNGNTQTLFGVGMGSSTISTTSLGTGNNSNKINNNNISKTQYGIYSQGASAANKNTGNIINLNLINTATPNNVQIGGIMVGFENNISIAGNNIAGMNRSTSVFGIAVGFVISDFSASTFTGNEVTNATISKNVIDNLTSTSTTGYSGMGIAYASAATGTTQISDNMISRVTDLATSPDFNAGIYVGGGAGSLQIYFNSVWLSGNRGTTASMPSYALAIGGSTPIVDIRNNALENTSVSTNATGKSYAIGLAYTSTVGNYANLTSNYNDFITSGASAFFSKVGGLTTTGTDKTTLAAWQAETGGGANSISGDPQFLSTSNLHINPAVGTTIESAGTPLAAVSDDIDCDTRNATTPDIGADEGNFIALVANDIAATAFIDPTNGGSKGAGVTFSPQASFTNSGTAAQTNVPVRYKITDPSNNVVYNQTATIASITPSQTVTVTFLATSLATGGTYTITASAELVGDQTPANDTINGTLIILTPLSGSFNVGTGQTYTSLTNTGGIFAVLNAAGASSNITIDITSDLTAETGANALNQLAAGITVTIKPSGAARTITSTAAASSLIRLNGADNVTIDGSLSGGTDQSLTLINSNTSSGTAVVRVDSLGVAAGATNDTIKNTVIQAGTNFSTVTASVTFGIFVGNVSGAAAGPDNDNLTIQNNLIQRAASGIQVVGDPTGLLDGLVIQDNIVGGAAVADYIGRSGIIFGQATGAIVTRNTVRNVVSSAANDVFGITVSTGTINSSVRRNTVSGMDETNTGGYGATGIAVSTAAASSGIIVANNFVCDIKGTSYLSSILGDTVVGIRITGTNTGGINVYDNSVNLFGSYAGFSGASITAAFMVNATTPTALDVRGNIFVNSFNNTAGTGAKNYAIYTNSANTMFTDINYNDYFVGGAQGVLSAINSSDATTLTALRTATGKDAQSISADPLFTLATNLHISTSGAVSPVVRAGISLVPTVTIDIDGDLRKATPEIGADEIVTYVLTYTTGANGSITGTSPQTVNPGGSGTPVTAVPNTGYHFVNWSDSSSANPRTDTNVTSNISVTANIAINSYTLTYTAGANGSISGTSPQTVNYGASGTPVTAVPNTGYHFVNWSDSSTANPRTDTNVTSNISVTANFAINSYTLTYTAGANGSISGTSPQTVTYGSDGTPVTAVSNTGYHFVDWSDGVLTATRTDTNVTANISVTANFAINTYTLTYTAGPNGTINGTSPQTVNYGANGTPVTAVPDAGYHFVSWSDSYPTAARTDMNVMADVNATATFAINTYTMAYDGNTNTGGTAPVDPNSPYNANASVTVLNQGTLVKAGYTFNNWNTAANGGGTSYAPGNTFNINANTTLFAQWTLIPSCTKTVLPNNGATSQNARAPEARFATSRAHYLITAAELAAAGYTNGASPTSIGWHYSTAPGVVASAPLTIYMENTADTTNLKSATWATAISTMTTVHNATTTLPNTTTPFDVTLTGGSSFTYTGGGIYVAYDWGTYTGTLSTTAVIACNNALVNGLKGANSNAATVTASSFRPETRLNGAILLNDAGVTALYSLGEIPYCLVGPQTIKAVITNNGTNTLTNLPVTLNITGVDTFTDTQTIASLAGCGGQTVVSFAAYTPGALGSDTVMVSVPADDLAGNNSLSKPLNNTQLDYSYKYPGSTASGGVGLTGATGAFVAKMTTTAANAVTAVKLEFAATSTTTYRVAIYGDSGTGTPSTTPLYVDASDRTVTAAGPVTITLPSAVAVGPGNFYVGVQQTNTINLSLSFDNETPIRSGAFYLATPNPVTAWSDFSPGNNFKLNIGAIMQTGCAGLTMTYNGNTNTSGVAPVDPNSPYNYNATVTVLGQGTLTKTGYTFSSWNTAANGSGTSYAPAATFNITANTTLFAQWALNTYQLFVVAGTGGTITAPPTSPVTVNHGAATTITAAANAGYTFSGWTVTTGTGSIANTANASTTITLTAGDATVTASFTLNTYQLSVVAGTGGTITVPATSPMTVNHGTATTITAVANAGYTFSGWAVTTGTGSIANAANVSTTITLTAGNATVTASFTPSSNANLSNLMLSTGPIVPVFNPNTTSYTLSVSNSTTSTTVTPTAADATATITVNGVTVASGTASGSISLNVGSNTITTVVTAQDGTTTKTYTVTVTRRATQTISGLAATDTKTYGDAAYPLSATASSGLAVSYSSSNTGVAAVSGNMVTIVGAGSTTITASQAGDNNYDPATNATQALTVNRKAVTVTADGKVKAKGASDPALTYTTSGLVTGDTLSGALSRNPGEGPGSYAILQGSVDNAHNANYTISYVGANLVITGPIAANDGATRPTNSPYVRIALSSLLANDTRIASDGTTQTDNLSITGVTAGTGNTVAISGTDVIYTPNDPSASLPLSFTYTLSDGSSTDIGTVTVTTVAPVPVALQIVSKGGVAYNGTITSITVNFVAQPNQDIYPQYATDVVNWTNYANSPVNTGATGSFAVTFTAPGDMTALWTKGMQFRATR